MTTESGISVDVLAETDNIPIKSLRLGTRNTISMLLNPTKVIPNDSGLPRDWRGLAHLIGLKSEEIPVLAFDTDPTARILHLWHKQSKSLCTVKQLQTYLEQLDRYDIVHDTAEMIEKDIAFYINEPEKFTTTVSLIEDEIDRRILTTDDVFRINQGLDTQIYDAFVVFADEDIDFATELIETMEKQYGLKLCVKERDLVAGLPFEHKAIIELISKRCNRLIVIISPAYLKSSVNKFVVDYAQALGIEQGKRKIIPCLYEMCVPPLELRHIFMLNYQRSGKLYNFWERLKDSIQAPKFPSPRLNTQRPVSQEIRVNHAEKLPELKPALVSAHKTHLKPKKEGVKFGSCSNLPVDEANEARRSVSVNGLNAESDSSTCDSNCTEQKNAKNKTNWLKKLLRWKKNGIPCNGAVKKDKEKKKNKKVMLHS